MNRQTLKKYRKTHKETDYVQNWLKEHTDSRKVTVKHRKPKKDAINAPYYDKKPRFFEPEKQATKEQRLTKEETKTETKKEVKAEHKPHIKPKKKVMKKKQSLTVGEKIN
jgi:hypothetical protein